MRPPLVRLLLWWLLTNLNDGLLNPVLPKLILRCLGDDDAKYAELNSGADALGALVGFLVAPLLGRLSDLYGRKLFLVLYSAASLSSNDDSSCTCGVSWW